MHLNIPILDQLMACENLLIAGMGGGFDIFCGLPIYFELTRRGKKVHLANYSFSPTYGPPITEGQHLTNTLVGVTADIAPDPFLYFPELYLAQWFQEHRSETLPIWCFHSTGVRPLLHNYEKLVKHLSIDGVLLVDGGVDSLMRGDEAMAGTLLEDSISLVAVDMLGAGVKHKWLAAVGLGAEQDIAYAQVFENIAALTKVGGFLGTCALTPQMDAYGEYEAAVLYVQDNPRQDPSVINSSLVSAVQGYFGDYHLTEKTAGNRLWISPLMSLYWFFDLATVAQQNLIYSQIQFTQTTNEAFTVVAEARQLFETRRYTKIRLT